MHRWHPISSSSPPLLLFFFFPLFRRSSSPQYAWHPPTSLRAGMRVTPSRALPPLARSPSPPLASFPNPNLQTTHFLVELAVIHTGPTFLLDNGCESANLVNFSTAGNVVVIVRGGCSFAVKAGNIAATGAVGMVVVDNCRENSDMCRTNVAPVMSLGDADVSDSVYDLVALAVTEEVGIQMLELSMHDSTISVTIEKNVPEGGRPSSDGNSISYTWPVTTPPHPLRLALTRGHGWRAPTLPSSKGGRRTPSVSSRVGSRLPLPLYADVRLVAHSDDS